MGRINNYQFAISNYACGGSLQKSSEHGNPTDLLDRGCISRQSILSRKERKEHKEILKLCGLCELCVRLFCAAEDCREPAHQCSCTGQTFRSPSANCVISLAALAPLPPFINLRTPHEVFPGLYS